MSVVNEQRVLNYLMQKKEQFNNRSICLGQDMIASALGVQVTLVSQLLASLAERGKVHQTSPGCWALGKGTFGRWG